MIGGIDLGGTQVRVAVARSDGRIVRTLKTRTAAFRHPEDFADWCASALDQLSPGRPLTVVAIGAPGPCDPSRGVIINAPNLPPAWPKNVPVTALLAARTGAPVHLENDANLAALGEHRQGAGRGTRNLVYITWSTGIGSGLILDGKLYSGAHGAAGEVGHTIVEPDGQLCGCGQRGCLETVAGGAGLARQSGHPAAEIFAAAARGDAQARLAVERAARMFGIALVNLANLIDPEVIVIGGGVTRSWSLVRQVVLEPMRASPFVRPERRPKLVRARLGAQVTLVGAVEWARTNL